MSDNRTYAKIGRVQPIHKGKYNNEAEYELNHVVTYNGSLYWHSGKEPTTGVPPTDTSVWTLSLDGAYIPQMAEEAQTARDEAVKAKEETEQALGEWQETYDPAGKKQDIFAYTDDAVEAERNRAAGAEGVLRESIELEASRAKGVEGTLRGDVDKNKTAINVLNGSAETEGSVSYQIALAVEKIMNNPDDTLNSIQELVNWINSHATDAAAIVAGLDQAKRDIDALEEKVGSESVAVQISKALTAELAKYATTAQLNGVNSTASNANSRANQAYTLANNAANAVQQITNTTIPNAKQQAVDDAKTYTDEQLAGYMPKSVYDPQGYGVDVFDYINKNAGAKRYGVLWDAVNAKCTARLWDAANITLDTTNFGHFGSVNENYNNPFDDIYPWSEIRLCNYSIAAFLEIVEEGYDVRDAVVAWEGEAGFTYNPEPGVGVGRYRPRFWHTRQETPEGVIFAVSPTKVLGWTEAEPVIGGRWFGTLESMEIGGTTKTVLGCRSGVPATSIAMSTLHTYAENGGMTIDDIYSIDADNILYMVEFANHNSQTATGNGCSSLYRQSSDTIQAAAENTNTIQVVKANASAVCIVGAIIDIGTSNGGRQIANRLITAVETDAENNTLLNVTISGDPITVTTAHFWSVHGIGNVADEEIGSKSGYIGANSKCNAYYRGQVFHANLWRYVLGAYRQTGTGNVWVANNRTEADEYNALNVSIHKDTGIVLPESASAYIKTLATTSGLSAPPICTETGGNSANPVGDYCYTPTLTTANTVLLIGGNASNGSGAGRWSGYWDHSAGYASWSLSAVPSSKSPNRGA